MFPSKHFGVAIAIRENTFLQHATCAAGRTRKGTEAGPGRRGLSDYEPIFASIPIESARENNSVRRFGSGARGVLDETPSRVVPVLLLDANGHIS